MPTRPMMPQPARARQWPRRSVAFETVDEDGVGHGFAPVELEWRREGAELLRNTERALRTIDELQKKIDELKKQREQQKDDKNKDQNKDDKKDKPAKTGQ